MQHLDTIIAAILLCVITSCRRDLDLSYHDIAPLTVIEGELTPGGIRVGITLTTPMDEPMDRTRLTDAAVTLSDLTAGTDIALTTDAEGYYADATPGIPGHRYRLTVLRSGILYRSETVMYPPAEILSLQFNWIKMPYDHVAILQGQFAGLPGSGHCYWIKIYRNGQIYQWLESTDTGSDTDGTITFITMTSRRDTDAEDADEVLYDGDLITVTLSPVTRTMYDYLQALRNDSSGPALFTATPVATSATATSDAPSDDIPAPRCLGYFTATTPVTATITFHPDDIPLYE